MALHYPNATWRPISHNVGGTIVPRAVVWHTAVDTGAPAHSSLFAWFNSTARKGTSAHMFIEGDGSAEQYVDFGKLAGHAFAANTFAIGVETHDGGNPNVPWTPAQVAQMVAFMRWCRSVFGIPIAAIKTASGSGHGYHSEFPSWNRSAHSCPGPVRVAQLAQVIATAAGSTPPPPLEDDDMLKLIKNPHNTVEIWLTNGLVRRPVQNVASAEGLLLWGVPPAIDVAAGVFDDIPVQS